MFTCFYELNIGKIAISESEEEITNLYFPNDRLPENIRICETPVLREAARQLESYLKGELKEFSLPLAPAGTEFMKRVWAALRTIPYGRTASYKEIAARTGNPAAVRAVGLANNKNPIPIFIPCHRIIGSNGTLTGYRGGLELKRKLLELEQAHASAIRNKGFSAGN